MPDLSALSGAFFHCVLYLFIVNETKIRKDYRKAAELIIRARAKDLDCHYVVLHDLYRILGADTAIAQNGVRWAVMELKEANVITSTPVRTVYSFEVI